MRLSLTPKFLIQLKNENMFNTKFLIQFLRDYSLHTRIFGGKRRGKVIQIMQVLRRRSFEGGCILGREKWKKKRDQRKKGEIGKKRGYRGYGQSVAREDLR